MTEKNPKARRASRYDETPERVSSAARQTAQDAPPAPDPARGGRAPVPYGTESPEEAYRRQQEEYYRLQQEEYARQQYAWQQEQQRLRQ